MASSQFTATSYNGFKSTGGPYSTLYVGFYDTNTTSYNKFTHAYRGLVFFNASAIAAALVGKIVDQIEVILTPINATRYTTSADWFFWITNLAGMPAAGTNVLTGLETDRVGDYFLEELTPVTFTKTGGQQSGVIASGAAAQRLADSLAAGNGMGLLRWHANNGTTVYCPSAGLYHGGTTTAPIIVITYHDAGSAQVRVSGVNRIAVPQVMVGGVNRNAIAQVNVGGVYRDCIGS